MKYLIGIVCYVHTRIVKIALSFLVLFSLLIMYWVFYPFYNPIHFYPDHLATSQLTFKAGEQIMLNAHYRKDTTDAPIYLSRWYENSIVVSIPSQIIQSKTGENQVKLYYTLPTFFEAGDYKVCELVKYRVNPIRTIEYRNCSNYFDIVD